MFSVDGARLLRGSWILALPLVLAVASCGDDDNPTAPPPPPPNKVLQLDGAGDYVTVPIENHTFNTFTVECRVKVASYDLNVHYISLYQNVYLILGDYGDQQISTWAAGLDPVDAGAASSEPTVSTDAWHHFAVSYDGTNQYILIDGEVAFTAPTTGTLINDAAAYNQGLVIGARYTTGIQYVTGQIDEVRIWSVYRTAQQIRSNMNKAITAQAGLVAYFNFDDGTPNDLSSFDANGTLVGDAVIVNK